VRSPESCFTILAREPVVGGQSSLVKEKLRIIATEDGIDREQTVLLKRTVPAEVVALRAANLVPGASAIPRLIQSGRDSHGDWIVIPFYTGNPAPTETSIPDNVMDSLAALHAHYLNSAPPGPLPIRDGAWWEARCVQPRLRQLARPSLQPIIEAIANWSGHRLIVEALTDLPRTVLHGDVHRNNVVVDGRIGRLIDWGGASYGIPAIDVVTPGPPGSPAYERYAAAWRELTGESTTSLAWRRGYLAATVCSKVDYLAFAARNFGDAAAIRMFDAAARALSELERLAAY
jgi:aminoglycoside phosphotransferase (APT) family kinase protein